MAPVPFLQLFRYASKEDLILLGIANLFILYSSLNIPLVNIVYGLMMREMNDFVARRAQFLDPKDVNVNTDRTFNTSTTSSYFMTPPPFNGTFSDAQEQFISNSYNLCMVVILFGLSRFVALYLALLFFSIAAANQAKRVKILFFKSLLRQEVSWFERNRTGDFAIRITSDLSKFEDGIGEKIALCLNALFAWISSLVSSFYYGWELTLVCLVLVPLTVFITTVIAEFQASYSIKESSALSRAFSVCHEVISSIRTVLAFSGQEKELERFKRGLDSAYKYGLRRNTFAGLNLGFTWMSGYLGFAICLLYSTKFYQPEHYGSYDEAHIITILWSAAGCVFLLNRMMPFIEIIQMARGSASNLFSVIERIPEIDVTSEHGLKPRLTEATVRFENVSFTYPSSCMAGQKVAQNSQEVPTRTLAANSSQTEEDSTDSGLNDSTIHRCTIKGLSLEAKAGQTIALVGPSGSGKSTALALLQRFYEIDEGSISVGGHDLRELNLAWLRSQFGVVTQEPVLFDMSIADNIRLGARPGQSLSDQDVEQAARSANAHAFIMRLPQGYETRAGARGLQLSGGQKQRIAIARALVRQPKILLLDEATSALDLESESVVQRALDQVRIGRTTFIVAHRLSTVRNADKILVFDRGATVECGTHEELLQQRGLYYQINAQQRQGSDLLPVHHNQSRRGSSQLPGLHELASTLGSCCAGLDASAANQGSSQHQKFLGGGRESRSLSIYSTGKYAAHAGGGLGAAGHGGNAETLDGSCAPAEPAGPDQFANDLDYYNRTGDEQDEQDDEDQDDEQQQQQQQQQQLAAGLRQTLNQETQCSLLDGLSFTTGPLNSAPHDPLAGSGAAAAMPGSAGRSKRPGAAPKRLSVFRTLAFIRPDPELSLLGILSSLVMGLCIPISAMIIGDLATIFAADQPEAIRHGLYTHGLLYTVLALLAFAISFIQVLSFGLAGEKIGSKLRQRAFRAILDRPLVWFDLKRNSPAAICAKLASDVGTVQSITGNRTAVIFQSISILLSTLVFALYFNLKFSAICVLFVAILLISTLMQARFAGKLALANRSFDAQMGRIVLESSANIKTVASLHQEQHFISKCELLLERDNRSRSLHNHLRLSLESLKYAMTAISKGSSFYFAARMLLHDEITIDVIFKLIEIILYGLTEASKSLIFVSDLQKARRGAQNLYRLVQPSSSSLETGENRHGKLDSGQQKRRKPAGYLRRFLQSRSAYQRMVGDQLEPEAEKDAGKKSGPLLAGLTLPPSPPAPSEPAPLGPCRGALKFEGVRFHYPGRPEACVLRSLSLDIKPGSSVALVGRSGCGKSTLVQLLERFYEPQQGSIQLDGHELHRLPLEWVRHQMVLVSQEPSLLSYSIADNIRYGDNSRQVPLEEVVRAAQVANIHDVIMALPLQYETQLNEASSLQLSGGQKQRIAIARALVRGAPIMLFDEATSALDSKSEQVVQQALERAQRGKTSIVIAHRLSTIKGANLIAVLKEGVVVEQGSHEELLEKRGEYYALYRTQSKL